MYGCIGLLDVTKCWLSIWGCVKLVGYDDTMRPFKFAFETWLVLCHCIACYKSTTTKCQPGVQVKTLFCHDGVILLPQKSDTWTTVLPIAIRMRTPKFNRQGMQRCWLVGWLISIGRSLLAQFLRVCESERFDSSFWTMHLERIFMNLHPWKSVHIFCWKGSPMSYFWYHYDFIASTL